MCLSSSPKQLEQPHPELVHWWLVQSSQCVYDAGVMENC